MNSYGEPSGCFAYRDRRRSRLEYNDANLIFVHLLGILLLVGRRIHANAPLKLADEQMNFGFVTGDVSINDACFYAMAYPQPDGVADLALRHDAHWHSESWTGAILPYAALVDSECPADRLLDYLRTVQAHGAKLMGH